MSGTNGYAGSTQIKWFDCLPEIPNKPARPDMFPPFTGSVAQNPSYGVQGYCGPDPPRHRGIPQRYGKGSPEAASAATDTWGLQVNYNPKIVNSAMTEEGSVLLPVNPQQLGYMPSIGQLNFLTTAQDKRLGVGPDRYYTQ